jgi:putative transposase
MRTSKAEVFLHFVWTTKMREPLILSVLEQELYRIIQSQVRKLGCDTIALNGTEDHVHLLIKYGRNVTLGRLMNQVKGVSSAFMNDRLRDEISAFR